MKLDFLVKLFKPLIKKLVLREIKNLETKKYIVDLVNSRLDIPKMTEAEEAKLLLQVYDASCEAAVTIIDRL